MTTYRVLVSEHARRAIEEQIAYIAHQKQSPLAAGRLLGEIDRAIDTLSYFPHRCPRAPEDKLVDYTVRMHVVKKSYLLLFRVDDVGHAVTVIAFRHGRRLPFEELPDA